ncbi:hypothetical protein [Psychrobacter urativorans]|uniref:DUF676 domain-containing protein n=1 Tax=Psychrobacter urativorans TaxID=45610 RepID=A0A0M4SZK4_9GAMM|nr:hypothetical protein [Psychrobacter urativorans]ALF60648.1 hypothetical protein AOC03_11840 [Psychrobacter urativorans]
MRCLLISLCCVSLLSCATIPDQAYHKIVCATKDSCSEIELDANIKPITDMVIVNGVSTFRENQVNIKEGDTIANTSFHLFYLEYAENGQKFEGTRQIEVIKRAITTANKPVYLVIYVNSWNNNASIDKPSPDLISFPYLLARRNFQNPEMTVIGVYVGWSGKKYQHFPATILSAKNRAKVADKIGKKGEVRADIISLVDNVQNNPHSGYALIVGKSFGGRLLSRAFIDDLAQTKSVKDWPLGSQSLLVTLNSAIGADAFDDIYQNMPGSDADSGLTLQRPLWINLTSKDDWVTKKAFPKARLIGQKLSDWGKKRTIGHYMPYVSHSITIENGDSLYKRPECLSRYYNHDSQGIQDHYGQPTPMLKVRGIEPWFKIPLQDPNYDQKNRRNEKENVTSHFCDETRHLYENKNASGMNGRYYTTVLRPLYHSSEKKLGYMWNFRTDQSVIGYSHEEARVIKNSGKHNAYVQTILGRMADDMLFTLPEQ